MGKSMERDDWVEGWGGLTLKNAGVVCRNPDIGEFFIRQRLEVLG